MKIILTHEQTDFDGLASLLGAHLLDEESTPVLPRRMNRNLRAFLTLYSAELPFVDPRDLRAQTIEAVTLVDTQALATLKGMTPQTQVRIIDHHTPRTDLPENWDLFYQETGANTTIFVEGIREQDLPLNVVQATLLLLGIYEDTGSLTYTRTTPRDLRAAAYLLEQGASLRIAHNYLNHPLSLAQQQIYDQLRQNAISRTIHGHTIVIAEGDARDLDEELSTIAHKMRDLLDPDALLLVIEIRGGVQLIARSNRDRINVSKIAAHFGGGGHARAAAALIKSRSRSAVQAELLEILPEFVQPCITIGEILSRDPQVLAPNTPVQKIAQMMQRYGYEGYPVVENSKIVGLVTRHAVDRAISHKLNLTAEQLMEAGNVHVHPDQSIEHLQNVMTDTGWGQIPVVERNSHRLIGIVTRTDLLKTLAPQTSGRGGRNLSAQLEAALPSEQLNRLKKIAKIAEEQRVSTYIVGGFVRDLLLGHPSLDFDIVVEGDAIALANAVQKSFGGRVTTHRRFGTAKWIGSGQWAEVPLDFITARKEFYTQPTALPTVERGSIKLDLHRRDFTINTLALRLDGRHFGDLHDYWGGYNDLRQGLVRVLHSLSFIDDPTRILRAVRYEQRYQFHLGERTRKLLLDARPLLARVSGDRIRHEIDNILAEPKRIAILRRLAELKVLEHIHPDLKWDSWLEDHLTRLETPSPEWNLKAELKGQPLYRVLAYALWLIRLPAPRSREVLKRLHPSSVIARTTHQAAQLWDEITALKNARPSQIANRLDSVPPAAIYAVYYACEDADLRRALRDYSTTWKQITPHTRGEDLQARGLPPGPRYREILSTLRNAWLDGEITSEAEEQAMLEQLVGTRNEQRTSHTAQ
ncbi:MAG TPA: CBS domain-containing protein [Anaerolineales bacterium]|nr:CBS domain-containing protein [Anaerolineales bacterium]